MHPILAEIGPLTLHSYGLFMAIGYLAALFVLVREGAKLGMDRYQAVDLSFYTLLWGLLGARLLFVVTQWRFFLADPKQIFALWNGGLVFYGGFLASLGYVLYFARSQKIPTLKLFDLGAMAICLAHAFGRIGCFLAGCCHGSACDRPWAVTMMSENVEPHLRGTPIHPAQLYEATALFLLFLLLRRLRSIGGGIAGLVAGTYVTAYAAIRFVVEYFRGDSLRGYLIEYWLSTSQAIALALFIAGAGAMVVLFRRRRS